MTVTLAGGFVFGFTATLGVGCALAAIGIVMGLMK